MTETLLQKLEEKTMTILTEVERLRNELKQLKQENIALRSEKENNSRKLQDLLSLLEATAFSENAVLAEAAFMQEEASAA